MYYSYQTTLKDLIESCVNTQTGAGLDYYACVMNIFLSLNNAAEANNCIILSVNECWLQK